MCRVGSSRSATSGRRVLAAHPPSTSTSHPVAKVTPLPPCTRPPRQRVRQPLKHHEQDEQAPFPQPTHSAHAWLLSWFLGAPAALSACTTWRSRARRRGRMLGCGLSPAGLLGLSGGCRSALLIFFAFFALNLPPWTFILFTFSRYVPCPSFLHPPFSCVLFSSLSSTYLHILLTTSYPNPFYTSSLPLHRPPTSHTSLLRARRQGHRWCRR
ncbi:hypothetical protein B0H19DRAFT_600680 [Mycena capillaripes]|nr:hypothetical protein B0H19DRAFT_600680 [Mycena capillaripes]